MNELQFTSLEYIDLCLAIKMRIRAEAGIIHTLNYQNRNTLAELGRLLVKVMRARMGAKLSR